MNKQKLSLLLKKIFLRMGLYGFIRTFFPNRKVAILRYHSVVERQNNFYTSPAIALSPAEFERHVRYFARKYTVLSLDQIVDHLQQKKPFPKNSVAFTFDDGYTDNLEAARILKKYGASGTFFITTEPIGRESKFWLTEVTYLILKTPKTAFNISHEAQQLHFSLRDRSTRWKAIREIVRLIKSNNRIVREEVRRQLLEQLGEAELMTEVENLILTWEQVRQMGYGHGHRFPYLNPPEPAQRRPGRCGAGNNRIQKSAGRKAGPQHPPFLLSQQRTLPVF